MRSARCRCGARRSSGSRRRWGWSRARGSCGRRRVTVSSPASRAGAAARGHPAHCGQPALGSGPHGAGRGGDAGQLGRSGNLGAAPGRGDGHLEEDRAMCRRIGEAGLPLVPDGASVLTHCNAGALATGGIGTALAPVYLATTRETGARLRRRDAAGAAGRPAHRVGARARRDPLYRDRGRCEGSLMRQAQVTSCSWRRPHRGERRLRQQDRYLPARRARAASRRAVLLRGAVDHHRSHARDGDGIPIEQRSPEEVKTVAGRPVAPAAAAALNPPSTSRGALRERVRDRPRYRDAAVRV